MTSNPSLLFPPGPLLTSMKSGPPSLFKPDPDTSGVDKKLASPVFNWLTAGLHANSVSTALHNYLTSAGVTTPSPVATSTGNQISPILAPPFLQMMPLYLRQQQSLLNYHPANELLNFRLNKMAAEGGDNNNSSSSSSSSTGGALSGSSGADKLYHVIEGTFHWVRQLPAFQMLSPNDQVSNRTSFYHQLTPNFTSKCTLTDFNS